MGSLHLIVPPKSVVSNQEKRCISGDLKSTLFSNIDEEPISILGENGILLLRPTLDDAYPSRSSQPLGS